MSNFGFRAKQNLWELFTPVDWKPAKGLLQQDDNIDMEKIYLQ